MTAGGSALPEWAQWNDAVEAEPWTVGLEEEVMLFEPATGHAAWRSEDVLVRLAPDLVRFVRAETHACALELGTDPHATVAEAIEQLGALRARLARSVRSAGMSVGVAGTHPLVKREDTQVSSGARYRELHHSLRGLASREPTFALHVHVAVPAPDQALRALNAIRVHLPVLLALSANSPFLGGRDTGLAAARIPVFQEFPRAGLPRAFRDYASYAEAIDALVRSRAIPEPTFIWWDARLQPRLGTLEVRVMDAQTRLVDTAALAALVQCLVRLEALEGFAAPEEIAAPELLEENRFLAARDGIDALLIEPSGRRPPASARLAELVDACRPHAEELGCTRELGLVAELAGDPGAARQRAAASEPGGVPAVLKMLEREFPPVGDPVRRASGLMIAPV
jgi:glutamate---cysteine ligase / carboxylate-amine ligase